MATRSFVIEQSGTIVATYRQGEGEVLDPALSVAEVQRASPNTIPTCSTPSPRRRRRAWEETRSRW